MSVVHGAAYLLDDLHLNTDFSETSSSLPEGATAATRD